MNFKYGTVHYTGARAGDSIRFVPHPKPGHPGAIFWASDVSTSSGTLKRVQGTIGYVELKEVRVVQAVAEGGSASGIHLSLPVTARGSLRVL